MTFEESLQQVLDEDLEGLIEARQLYGDSWRAEGGFSAYFNIKRKIDRFVKLAGRPTETIPGTTQPGFGASFDRERYDLFGHIRADVAQGGEAVLDCVRDLRRYLALVEAFMVESGFELPMQRDNLAAGRRHEKAEQKTAMAIDLEGFMKDQMAVVLPSDAIMKDMPYDDSIAAVSSITLELPKAELPPVRFEPVAKHRPRKGEPRGYDPALDDLEF